MHIYISSTVILGAYVSWRREEDELSLGPSLVALYRVAMFDND